MRRKTMNSAAAALLLLVRVALPEPAALKNALTLDRALSLALKQNPALAMAAYDVRVAESLTRQAGRLRNPSVKFKVEEYDRGGVGFESVETAISIGQRFELGGKRRWRRRSAAEQGERTGWDLERRRLDVIRKTTDRFVAVRAAQQAHALDRSMVTLAEQTARAVSERVDAGKEPPAQAAKAKAELELVRLDARAAANDLVATRLALVAMWGELEPAFTSVVIAEDAVLAEPPALSDLKTRLSTNPELAWWESEIGLRQAELKEQKAARIPDLQASAGYLQYEEDGTDAFMGTVWIEVPIFDRNSGNIEAARLAVERAEAGRRVARQSLARELVEAHAALGLAMQRVGALANDVLPAMQHAFDAAREGYKQGKFGVLEMLDAQRGLFQVQGALVDAHVKYHMTVTSIERLIGVELEEIR
jgi:cobalt-zinc-cadmium efflux system outer membrane protein